MRRRGYRGAIARDAASSARRTMEAGNPTARGK